MVVTKIMCAFFTGLMSVNFCASTTFTSPSELPTAMSVPCAFTANPEMGSLLNTRALLMTFHVATSHFTTQPSPSRFTPVHATLVDAFVPRPYAAPRNTTFRTPLFFTMDSSNNVSTRSPRSTLHTAAPRPMLLAVAFSADVVNSPSPSGAQAISVTAPFSCAPSSFSTSNDGHARIFTSPLSNPSANRAPSASNAAHLISRSSGVTCTRFGSPNALAHDSIVHRASPFVPDDDAPSFAPSFAPRRARNTPSVPPNAHTTCSRPGCTASRCGASSSVCVHASASASVVPCGPRSHDAIKIRFGIPLDFFPPPPARSAVRSSSHAPA
mmetsp:Transcript_7101/g.28712  ORF Transcript_7101/g.28712 Transcript_7101/m.28712 type:complete len:326 (+) Transcript_7101:389-1366(+)